jgi:hypothetical protein
VFIGIESPDEDSLKETKKLQNTREDILTSVRGFTRTDSTSSRASSSDSTTTP